VVGMPESYGRMPSEGVNIPVNNPAVTFRRVARSGTLAVAFRTARL